ncbi:MAG: alcohol dehydrogenase catalytic domain-containing protein [Thermoproteota archaeon]|nr:alcohol dehydrogenase catalytic domain-containing protein [Thermoproteota archaeon]
MKTVVIDNKSVKIINTELPKVNKNDVLVKMKSCGICGSDLEKVFGKYGMISSRIGHEPAGEIIEIGASVKNFKIKDRVFIHHHVPCYSCHYCYNEDFTMCKKYQSSNIEPSGLSEYILVPEWNVLRGGLVKLPDNINFNQAALIEPIACCIRSLNKLNMKKADKIAIFGAGPAGLIHMTLAKHFGASKIILIDINEFRLNFAKNIDSNISTINLKSIPENVELDKIVFSMIGNTGVDISIISTSNLDALVHSLKITRSGGTISLFGVPSKDSDLKIDFNLIYSKELKIIPSYATSEKEIHQTISLLTNNILDIEPLITHKFILDDSFKALNYAHIAKDAMKIIITSTD